MDGLTSKTQILQIRFTSQYHGKLV